MNNLSLKNKLENEAAVEVRQNVLLSDFTSFKIGGPAKLFVKPQTVNAISTVLSIAKKNNVSTLIIGNGTNLLISDDGFDGLVIVPHLEEIKIDEEKLFVEVGASVKSSVVAFELINKHFAGLEFAAGLPGTVGGAVAGNAGCFGESFSKIIIGATVVLSDGQIIEVNNNEWFDFDYRYSCLKTLNAVVTNLKFSISIGDRKLLKTIANDHLTLRSSRHPQKTVKTAGSYFKNLLPIAPNGRRRAAGALLEQVGAKTMTVGDAAVFEKHANIVINKANARAKDVLKLTEQMSKRVQDRFSILLEPEVRFVGRRPF